MIKSPELAAEVTLQPVNAFDLDAADHRHEAQRTDIPAGSYLGRVGGTGLGSQNHGAGGELQRAKPNGRASGSGASLPEYLPH